MREVRLERPAHTDRPERPVGRQFKSGRAHIRLVKSWSRRAEGRVGSGTSLCEVVPGVGSGPRAGFGGHLSRRARQPELRHRRAGGPAFGRPDVQRRPDDRGGRSQAGTEARREPRPDRRGTGGGGGPAGSHPRPRAGVRNARLPAGDKPHGAGARKDRALPSGAAGLGG